MAVAGILVISAVIIAFDVPHLLRKKLKKELWIFSILLLVGTVLSIAQALGMRLPNPLDWLTVLFKPFASMMENLLK